VPIFFFQHDGLGGGAAAIRGHNNFKSVFVQTALIFCGAAHVDWQAYTQRGEI
jgi:hypothetical protein